MTYGTRPFRFYVGQSVDVSFMTHQAFLQVTGRNVVHIIDREIAGVDDLGHTVYKYRLDVGNPLVELWINDTILVYLKRQEEEDSCQTVSVQSARVR